MRVDRYIRQPRNEKGWTSEGLASPSITRAPDIGNVKRGACNPTTMAAHQNFWVLTIGPAHRIGSDRVGAKRV